MYIIAINMQNGETALHIAARQGHLAVTNILILERADVTCQSKVSN